MIVHPVNYLRPQSCSAVECRSSFEAGRVAFVPQLSAAYSKVAESKCAEIPTPLLLQLTGLYYVGTKDQRLRRIRILLVILLVLLVAYQTVHSLYVAAVDVKFSAQMAHTLINFNWMLQAIISMAFLLHWQSKGHLPALFRMMRHCSGYSSRFFMHRISSCIYGLLFLLDVSVVVIILALYFAIEPEQRLNPSKQNQVIKVINVYGSTLLSDPLFIPVHYYTRYVWLITLIVFISTASGIQHQIRLANDSLRKLGSADEPIIDRHNFGDALAAQLMEHIELAKWIRGIDRVFGVYTFCMVCLNIPVAIFSLSMLLLTLPKSPQWLHICFPMVDILFSICELVGLVVIPSKIHTDIHEVEKIIFDSLYIWKNMNTRIFQLANSFIMYANQPSLGITLWGFVVIRKPLILTTISLTATYLTALVQFNSDTSCTHNQQLANGTSPDIRGYIIGDL